MSLVSITYDTSFEEMLKTLLQNIDIINNDYEDIFNLIKYYRKILQDIKPKTDNINNLLKSDFFVKSILCFSLKFKNYEPSNNSILLSNSRNSKFTIADVIKENEENKKRLFFKIVDYKSQVLQSTIDLIIYDVFNSIIFEKLLSLLKNNRYRDYIPKYEGCILSYSASTTKRNLFFKSITNQKWNYNDLIYTNKESPYNYKNISSANTPYKEKVVIFITEALNNPLSIAQIFGKYYENPNINNKELMMDVIINCYKLYEFIKYIGYEYGFMHNDLHMGNILYDENKNKLVLIDFGRSSFAIFLERLDQRLNNILMSDFLKLSYNEVFSSIPELNNYIYMFKIPQLYRYSNSIIINRYYFGVIYDLIAFALNIYIRTIYYINKLYNSNFDKFINFFQKIIEINYYNNILNLLINNIKIKVTSTTIDELINSYIDIKDNYINTLICKSSKEHFTFLLEGLFYTALLLHSKNEFRELEIRNYNGIFNRNLQVISIQMYEFYRFINTKLSKYNIILRTDNFLSKFIPIRGGKLSSISKNRLLKSQTKKTKNIKLDSFSLFNNINKKESKEKKDNTLEDTLKAYEEYFIYNKLYNNELES